MAQDNRIVAGDVNGSVVRALDSIATAIQGGAGSSVAAFSASAAASQSVANNVSQKLLFGTVSYDNDSSYNVSTSEFVAKVQGVYLFTAYVAIDNHLDTKVAELSFAVNGLKLQRFRIFSAASTNDPYITITAQIKLAAADIASVYFLHDYGSARDINAGALFSGCLLIEL